MALKEENEKLLTALPLVVYQRPQKDRTRSEFVYHIHQLCSPFTRFLNLTLIHKGLGALSLSISKIFQFNKYLFLPNARVKCYFSHRTVSKIAFFRTLHQKALFWHVFAATKIELYIHSANFQTLVARTTSFQTLTTKYTIC